MGFATGAIFISRYEKSFSKIYLTLKGTSTWIYMGMEYIIILYYYNIK